LPSSTQWLPRHVDSQTGFAEPRRFIVAYPSNPALHWVPDEFVHLKLKTDVEFVFQNPIHNLARIDPAKDR
jgi:hypothetical protein